MALTRRLPEPHDGTSKWQSASRECDTLTNSCRFSPLPEVMDVVGRKAGDHVLEVGFGAMRGGSAVESTLYLQGFVG